MDVESPVPQVVHLEDDVPALRRLADQRDFKRAEVLGEDRDDVDAQRGISSRARRDPVRGCPVLRGPVLSSALAGHVRVKEPGRGVDDQPPGRDIDLDRKSTRLNSSHANISYAVFCLKKKKT